MVHIIPAILHSLRGVDLTELFFVQIVTGFASLALDVVDRNKTVDVLYLLANSEVVGKGVLHQEVHQSLLGVVTVDGEVILQVLVFIENVPRHALLALGHVEVVTDVDGRLSDAGLFVYRQNVFVGALETRLALVGVVDQTAVDGIHHSQALAPGEIVARGAVLAGNGCFVLIAVLDDVFLVDLDAEKSARVLVVVLLASEANSVDGQLFAEVDVRVDAGLVFEQVERSHVTEETDV